MKALLRTIFSPLLNKFESSSDEYTYMKSHRVALIAMGAIFTGLASVVFYLALGEDVGYLIPVLVFGGVGIVSLIIGLLGEDKAVAKIWGSNKK